MSRFPLRARWLCVWLASSCAWLPPQTALANPSGAVVHAGSATVTGQGTPTVTIHQATGAATISWKSFDIQSGEVTNFVQPSKDSVAINRILDQNPSKILGALNANGNVYLINPNGVLFGQGAQVNVNGLAVAASYRSRKGAQEGGFDASATAAPGAAIVNEGTIRTGEGGFVYLVAPRVENGRDGVIVAPGGEVLLAAGTTVHLTDRLDGRGVEIAYAAPGRPGDEPVRMSDALQDASFSSLRAGALRQAGIVEANAVRERNGRIELYAESALELASGSRTAATGDSQGPSDGGRIVALSDGDAVVGAGATIDVSGGTERGRGGFAEVSAKRELALAGTFRADGHGGERGGEVLIDPEKLSVTSTTFSGAQSVNLWASRTVAVENGAQVRLQNASGTPTLALRSGRDVTFGRGARISDESDGGASGANHWNVEIVAGAKRPEQASDLEVAAYDPATPYSAATADAHGSIFLSGAQRDGSGHVVRNAAGEATLQGGDAEVSLRHGKLTLRAAKDVVVGNGGGLRNERGDIDVAAGRNVRFTAASTTTDGVIENGSGSIRVVAGDSVILTGQNASGATVPGNAAIRTRGLSGFDDLGRETRTNGGSIFVRALRGDVDAGLGNRWLQPGGLIPDAAFDPMPVFRGGILGIGTEAGGDVTVIAGRDVFTSRSSQHSGGSASGLAPDPFGSGIGYDGSHIGTFGGPVVWDYDDEGFERPRPLEGGPSSNLKVVAGRNLTGDYMVRNGTALLRAGYDVLDAAPAGVADVETLPVSLAPGAGNAVLAPSAAALRFPDPTEGDRAAGWLGTLSLPLVVDLIRGSLDGRGRNGVVVDAIQNPSLVYPQASQDPGTFRVATYGENDRADLEAATGDVILLGARSTLPMPIGDPRIGSQGFVTEENALVRLLPPNVRIRTQSFTRGAESRGGDLVLLNDFVLFPSASGGLTLDVAGQVRTAAGTAATAADLALSIRTVGAAREQAITLPLGTRLLDPVSGIEYVLTGQRAVRIERRLDAQQAIGSVELRPTRAAAAAGPIVVPAGTRIAGINGQLYETTVQTVFQAPSQRFATGTVIFQGSAGAQIAIGTRLRGSDGTLYRTVADATIARGQSSVSVRVVADTPGRDASPLSLRLLDAVPSITSATNFKSIARPATFEAPVRAVEAGAAGNLQARRAPSLITPVAGIESVINVGSIGGGAEIAESGLLGSGARPSAVATVRGPVGALGFGKRLVLADASVLPAGVSASEVLIEATALNATGSTRPSIFRELRVRREGGVVVSTAPDLTDGSIVSVTPGEVWQRSGTGDSVTLRQSDAAPGLDARIGGAAFDYERYYRSCNSGTPCSAVPDPETGRPLLAGSGPTHADDRTPSQLRAAAGFTRVRFELAKSATLSTDGSLIDTTLRVQHASAADVSRILVPYGNASFGGQSRVLTDRQLGRDVPITIPGDPSSGFQVAGPGEGRVLVGVVPFAEADANADGRLTPDEFGFGPGAIFDAYDDLESPVPGSPLFRKGYLTEKNVPYVPTGRGGQLLLAQKSTDPQARPALGIESIGNTANPALPAGGASLVVATAGDVRLNELGSIGSLQGGTIRIDSLGGGLIGGDPGPKVTDRRGVFSVYVPPGLTSTPRPPAGGGGGSISVRVYGDFDIGRSALAALSGGNITLQSVGASITAGRGARFENATVNLNPTTGLPEVRYEGAGIEARGGDVVILARRDINIGAGIAGRNVSANAGGAINAGSGSIAATGNVSLSATSVSGSISAGGVASISGSSSGASVSAAATTGTVAAATPASSAVQKTQSVEEATGAGSGGGLGSGPRGPRKGVIIDVSLQPCADEGSCRV